MLYQLRFLITAELLGALPNVGGLSAGLNRRSIVLNLDTAESIAVALAYDRLAGLHLEGKYRARAETALDGVFFESFLSRGGVSFRTHSIAECAHRPASSQAATPAPKAPDPPAAPKASRPP